MEAKKIIACLDIQNGRTVKGINFENITDAGDPAILAAKYSSDGADELVFLDITATLEKRKNFFELVRRLAPVVEVPFTVGGGIGSASDIEILLKAGASKISMSTAAFLNPDLIEEASRAFGSDRIVIAIDVARRHDEWFVAVQGGKKVTDQEAVDWAKRAAGLGAGEILLTSMEHDGTGKGFAIDITAQVAAAVPIPVIASGGAGKKEDFKQVFEKTQAAAALGAGIFHRGEVQINELKRFLADSGIPVSV